MTTPDPAEIARLRSLRSESFIPSATLAAQSATIIGCGAVGRQVALMLASMGFSRLTLWDPDTVSPENLGPQQWIEVDVGRLKVDALLDDLFVRNPATLVTARPNPFGTDSQIETPFVFSCVDNMEVRRTIADRFQLSSASLLIDTRMTAFYYEVHAVTRPQVPDYIATIFPQSEADPLPCTAKATAYCANACAAMAVHTLIEHLRGHEVPPWFGFDLFSRSLPANPHVKSPTPEVAPPLPPKKKRRKRATQATAGQP